MPNPEISMRIEVMPGLREQVVDRLRMAIVAGRFQPGARLIERELCEMMDVSRTSLREALRELQADGLVTQTPNKGITVSVITYDTAKSIYEVRRSLEGLATRLFAERASAQQISDLRQSVEQLSTVYADFSADEFISAKQRFYDILFAGAGNEIAADLLRRIHARASQLRVMSLSSSSRTQQSIGELRDFVEALARRDADAAWEICMIHLDNAGQAALAALQDSMKQE